MSTSLPPLVLLSLSKCHPSASTFTWCSVCACVCVSKCPQFYWIRATLMPSFYFDHLCKDLISK